MGEVKELSRIRSGDACPSCGATVRAPTSRIVVARVSIVVLAIVIAAASVFGMMYSTACKACGTVVALDLN